MSALAFVMALLSTAVGSPAVQSEGSREAREQARRCERENGEEGLQACRSALQLALAPGRRRAVRELLARHLVSLERWSDLADHYRESVGLDPQDAGAWFRLGSTLLFAVDDAPEAVAALGEAARLAPGDAETRVALALALLALGRHTEATAQFDEALRLDPGVLDLRPAAEAAREAARSGQGWP